MSTPQTTSYSYSSSKTGSLLPGWSAFVIFAAALASIAFPMLDLKYHGHFNCEALKKQVEVALENETHLATYMQDHTDDKGNIVETGKVECQCNQRKLVLVGKVVNNEIRQEFSDIAARTIGIDRVDNQIEALNEEPIQELQKLVNIDPRHMNFNYVVKDRGTIHLTGDLPSPEMGKHVEEVIAKMKGVRRVINDLGRQLEAQRVLVVRNIYFDFNKFDIRPESKPALDEASQYIEQFLDRNPDGSVEVQGHTDKIAGETYNKWLSQKRADAVLHALVGLGIPGDKLKAVGYGKTRPIVENDNTPEKRQENRRIEFHFKKAGEK